MSTATKIAAMTPATARTLRESLGLTAQWIADRHGVSKQTITKYESGNIRVSDEYANLLDLLDQDAGMAAADALEILQFHPIGERHYSVPALDSKDGYPASWWRAIAARIRTELPDLIIDYAE